jgi:hypothetical protein
VAVRRLERPQAAGAWEAAAAQPEPPEPPKPGDAAPEDAEDETALTASDQLTGLLNMQASALACALQMDCARVQLPALASCDLPCAVL